MRSGTHTKICRRNSNAHLRSISSTSSCAIPRVTAAIRRVLSLGRTTPVLPRSQRSSPVTSGTVIFRSPRARSRLPTAATSIFFAPGGAINVGLTLNSNAAADQGILTEAGGNISIFTRDSVNVGTSRIFTLRGGNEIIWSTLGDIAAGVASKTVQSAPPTRVLIDPQSGDVKTDLAGLATGGGIGVLETVVGVPPADVDLIAPNGTIDAGDAGIRVSGNLNISALLVLNAGNIQVAGASAGVPTVAAPNIGGLTAASNASAATTNAATQVASQNRPQALPDDVPSIIEVEVLGYGGSEGGDDEDQRKKQRQGEANATFQ